MTGRLRQGVRAPGFWRGFAAGLLGFGALGVALVPARLALALWGHGGVGLRAERFVAGWLVDLAAAAPLASGLLLALCLVGTALAVWRWGQRWQALGPLVAALPVGFALWVLSVVAQEVKRERGAFPTMFDLHEGVSSGSSLWGAITFVAAQRVWAPGLVGVALLVVLAVVAWRRRRLEAGRWAPWAGGVTGALMLCTGLSVGFASSLSSASNRFSGAAVGDPLTGLVESTIDVVRHRGPATPRELVLSAGLPAAMVPEGASRLGWPPRHQGCAPHLYARPLDWTREGAAETRGRRLLDALGEASTPLFADGRPVAIFYLSLEGFRADDVHALNPHAPRDVAPFVNGLYEAARAGGRGVVASSQMYQAGVRTAQGLGAYLCGLGTLPYNLSLIRDLQPFPVRCLPDVLGDAGFAGAFFYGSDPAFDGMAAFLRGHGVSTVVSEADFPKEAPRGTWGAVTDFAVFDEAVARTARGLESGASQLALVMSLSHHSPFTAPDDVPEALRQRVHDALASTPNRAADDDVDKLVTYAYTDAAVERLLAGLEAAGIADRSLLVLGADHSTGHAYVWGPPSETDAQKAQIPFAVVVPEAFRARVDAVALDAALRRAQALMDEAPLSQNDVPAMLLALLSASAGVRALPEASRWHTLGGQVTSPSFASGGPAGTVVLGVNGVSQLYALGSDGQRLGGYEDSVFLKTRADRYRVTPTLIPVTATLAEVMRVAPECP